MWRSRCIVLLTLIGILLTAIFSAQAQGASTYVTIQRFESGLMIWRADTSTIYALGSNGTALVYPSGSYANLPDNPIFGTPPSRLRPIFGFGKVWGNAKKVRDLLGWPTLQEIGFNTSVRTQNQVLIITELDGSIIEVNRGTWTRSNVPPENIPTPRPCPYPFFVDNSSSDVCPSQPIITQAAYQPFENGFMIWLAHSGDVWVFPNSSNLPPWLHLGEANYAGFPDAPTQQPPANRVQPVNAFGRVWHNLKDFNGTSLSKTLGWATAGETGYTATYQLWGRTSHVHQYLSLPDGRVVDAYSGLAGFFWSWFK